MPLKQIESYRAKSQWFTKEGSYLIQTRKRGPTITLHCYKEKCPVKCFIKNGIEGPIQGEHNHSREPWIPSRNALFQALKKRVASDHRTPLSNIYKHVAARFPDAAPHMLFETVSHSMRKWRRNSKCPAKQITEQMKSPKAEKDTQPAVYVISQTSSPIAEDTDGMEIEHLDMDQLDEDESNFDNDNISTNSELLNEQTDCEDDQDDQKNVEIEQLDEDESYDYRPDQDEEDNDNFYYSSPKRQRPNRSPVKVKPPVPSQTSTNQNHRRKKGGIVRSPAPPMKKKTLQ